MNDEKYSKTLPLIFFILVLLIWEGFVRIANISTFLLPPPLEIFHKLIINISAYADDLFVTFIESFAGLLISIVVGLIIVFIFIKSKPIQKGLFPYVIALKSVPIVAIAPLFIVWFGNGIIPKLLISAIISFFPIVVNMIKGLNEVDQEALDLFKSFAATKNQILIKLRLKHSLPYLFAALKMSSTLSVIGSIVAEFAGSDKGLGFRIIISSHRLETVDMFISIILSSLMGISFYYFFVLMEKIAVPWSKDFNN